MKKPEPMEPFRVPRPAHNRKVSEATKLARGRAFRRYIADDVADFLALRMNVSSPEGKRLLRKMKQRVIDYRKRHPGASDQDARDEVTTDVIAAIRSEEEKDKDLRYLVSP